MVLPLIPLVVGASALAGSAYGIVGSINERRIEEEDTKQAEIEADLAKTSLAVTGRLPLSLESSFWDRNKSWMVPVGIAVLIAITAFFFVRGRK